MRESKLLSSFQLYEGTDVDDARETLSRLFTNVSVEPISAGAPYGTLVNGLKLQRSAICYCEYPHGMIAGPEAPLDFHTVQLSLSGGAAFNIDGKVTAGDIHRGVMLSANEKVQVRHTPGNSILSFIVKDEVVREVLTAITGRTDLPTLRFARRFDRTDPRTASFLSFLQLFVTELNRSGGVLESPAAIASFEHTLITFMLFGLDHNLSGILRSSPPIAGAEKVRFVEEYITAHAAEPITMETITQITGQSAKAIYRAFRKYRNQTPMQFLYQVRMNKARQRLLQPQPLDTVSRVSNACGFTHLGRFSVEYKRCFGESPKDTLQHAVKLKRLAGVPL